MKPYENKWKFINKPLFKAIGCNQVSKKSIRRHAKKEIEKELGESDFACDWKENGYGKKCEIECDWCKHWNNYLETEKD